MTRGRFWILFALTSAAGAVALALLNSGSGGSGSRVAGGIAAALALLGVLLLARIVLVTERARR